MSWASEGSSVFVYSNRLKRYFTSVGDAVGDIKNHPIFRIIPYLILSYSIITFFIFNFHHYIEKILNSGDICSNQLLYKIMSWILPKAASHCDMMLMPEVYFNPYKEIAIILDFWLFFVFSIQAILGIKIYSLIYYRRKNEWAKLFHRRHGYRASIMLVYLFILSIVVYMTFFEDSLVPGPHAFDPWMDMLSGYYGIGVTLRTLAISWFSFVSIGLLTSIFLTIFSKNSTWTQAENNQ